MTTDIKKYDPLWGSWRVDSPIGEGSFGKVYKVRKEEFGTTYYSAVKIISIPPSDAELRQARSEGLDDDSARSYFHALVTDIVQEIDLMSAFRGNSNIVSFEDHKVIEREGEIGWDILIRMELLTTLFDHVTEAAMAEDEVVKLGVHICRALELCALKKTIHRDVKPENIFVSQYGEYKLGDFGIARQIERTMSGLSKKGTYTYMAPEVFKGDEYGASVDVYSLGIVMYRFLNRNRTPFLPDFPTPIAPRDRDEALQRRMSGEAIPPIEGVDPALNAVVLKACAFDRRDRFGSAAEMREALEALGNGGSYAPAAAKPAPAAAATRAAEATFATFAPRPERTEGVFGGARSFPRGGEAREKQETHAEPEAGISPGLLRKLAIVGGASFGLLALLCWPGRASGEVYMLFPIYAFGAVQCALSFRNGYANAAFAAVLLLSQAYSLSMDFGAFDYYLLAAAWSLISLAAAGVEDEKRRRALCIGLATVAVFSAVPVVRAMIGVRAEMYQPHVAGAIAVPIVTLFISACALPLARGVGRAARYGAAGMAAAHLFPLIAFTLHYANQSAETLYFVAGANLITAVPGRALRLAALAVQPAAFVSLFLGALARMRPALFAALIGKEERKGVAICAVVSFAAMAAVLLLVSAALDRYLAAGGP